MLSSSFSFFCEKPWFLEQYDFCTEKVRFHQVEIEVILLQTIFPMDLLCSPLFFHLGP